MDLLHCIMSSDHAPIQYPRYWQKNLVTSQGAKEQVVNKIMVLSREETVLIFSVITNFLVTRYGIIVDATDPSDPNAKFLLTLEEYPDKTGITATIWKDDPIVIDQPISKIKKGKRRDICVAAKKLAQLDGMGPKDDSFYPYGYTFDIPDSEPREIFAVRCSTIPVSFIYLLNPLIGATAEDKTVDLSQVEIGVLLKKNKFKSQEYKFITVVLQPDEAPILQKIPRIGPPSLVEHTLALTENTIVKPDTDLLDICHAAKIRCEHEPRPILHDDGSIKKRKIYQFPNYLAYAIKCPSTPRMYLTVTESDYKINVNILLEGEETESKLKMKDQKLTKASSKKQVSSAQVNQS